MYYILLQSYIIYILRALLLQPQKNKKKIYKHRDGEWRIEVWIKSIRIIKLRLGYYALYKW